VSWIAVAITRPARSPGRAGGFPAGGPAWRLPADGRTDWMWTTRSAADGSVSLDLPAGAPEGDRVRLCDDVCRVGEPDGRGYRDEEWCAAELRGGCA